MRRQGGNQFVDRARGMSDSVENGHNGLDAEALGRDSIKGSRHQAILVGEDSAQIQQDSSLLDAGNDGRIGRAEAVGQLVGAEALAG